MVAGSTPWHPDKYYLMPSLMVFQHLIYDIGIKFLPEDDAEIGYWTQQWFIYPYSRKLRAASRDAVKRIYPEKIFPTADGKLLNIKDALAQHVDLKPKESQFADLAWFCLETMATKEMRDQQMHEGYLRNYPGMAHFYAYYAVKGYTKLVLNSARLYIKMPTLIEREKKLLNWLVDLNNKWDDSIEIEAFIEENPKVEAMQQMAIILLLHNIVPATIWSEEFSCNSQYISELYTIREDLVYTKNGIQPPLGRMKDIRTAKQFYYIGINSYMARFLSFITHKKCGYNLPGIEDMTEFQGSAVSPEDYRKIRFRSLFRRELELLGMEDVLTEKYWTRLGDGEYEWK